MIIKHPMDFSTMKEKIKNNDYQSIEELKVIVDTYILVGEKDRAIIGTFFIVASDSWILCVQNLGRNMDVLSRILSYLFCEELNVF